jgi:hypothetical protein
MKNEYTLTIVGPYYHADRKSLWIKGTPKEIISALTNGHKLEVLTKRPVAVKETKILKTAKKVINKTKKELVAA